MAEAGPSKKRKRTGKAREEARKAAIAANLQHEETDDVALEPKPEIPMEVEDESKGLDLDAVSDRIPRGLKALHPIFKQGRTFEVRRIVKKIKSLRTKEGDKDEIKNLESQLALLSHLPLDHTNASHLLIKLQKHPQLKHSTLPSSITSQLKSDEHVASTSSQSDLLGKVENRLCSNKTVSEGVKAVVAWIMGKEGAKLPSGAKWKQQHETSPLGPKRDTMTAIIPGKAVANGYTASAPEDDNEADFEDGEDDAAGWESGSISGSDVPAKSRPRMDPSEDLDSGEEEDSDDDMAVPIPTRTTAKNRPLKPDTKPPKPVNDHKKPVTSSTFLPSLSAGFTLGDSDSDPDLDPDIDGSGLVGNKAVRKNRRGQRARQAIWEQKFGKHAKHVIARQRAEEDAQRAVSARANRGRGRGGSAGTGPGRWGSAPVAAVNEGNGRDSGYGQRGRPFVRGGRGGPTGHPIHAHADTQSAASPAKSVHPSWEAAKLRKQKELSAVKPQGTKIVFD